MMKLFRKNSLKTKAIKESEGVSRKNQKRKRNKRKTEKHAKIRKYSKNHGLSEIYLSLDDDKMVISEDKSDLNIRQHNRNNESDEDFMEADNYSSSFLEHFFKGSSDESCSNAENEYDVLQKIKRESSQTYNTSEYNQDDSNDPIESNDLIENSPIEKESDTDSLDTGYEIHEYDKDYVVILKYSNTLRILGFCDLKVLHGKIDILGHSLDSSSPINTIYSPKGSALLTLQNILNYSDEIHEMKNLVKKLSKHPILKDLEVRKDSSVLLLMKKHDSTLKFIEEHISQWILPKKTLFPCIEINPKGSWNAITIPPEWNEVVQNATGHSKILVCGGKGVGKSTFLRYAVNCLIQKYKSVKVVDLDPGQSEFSVPSTLSIVTVSKPLLGVNYTHLKTADRAILCDINIAPDPNKFIECLQEITKKEVYTENVPTIINTMGFTNDLAFHLIASTVALLKPNHIVYIESNNRKKNFKRDIDQRTLLEYAKFFTPNSNFNFSMDIEKIPSATDENVGWALQSRQMREMCILAYFGQSMGNGCSTLQDHKLPMYEVDLLDISICDRRNVNVPIESVKANIVALCRLVNDADAIFECFGWGIVRCHNASTRGIILITPINQDTLEKVTHLVVGGLTLPPSVYMNHEGVVGHIPYIFESDLKGFDQMSKRTRIPFDADKK